MAKRKASLPEDNEPTPKSGEYTVLARRYRPQQFADLVGQEAVAKAMTNAIHGDRVAHAYLFTGARGVGKTSTARILAKALNCEKGPTPTPCEQCEICLSIASGEDIDVLEIDGASNRGIDEVRAIRQNVATRPNRARYKIYIIDEVHMLTGPAFNALLKTLEEPPPHVKFIFATTEVQKIPITILSRCQRFDFAGIGTSRIVERLKQVVSAEGMQADDDALQIIARRAGGSMRDAQSLLDQLLAFGGERLTQDQVHQLLGSAGDDRILALVASIFEQDAGTALGILRTAADDGLQLGEFLDQLIEFWRGMMILSSAGSERNDLNLSENARKVAVDRVQNLTLDAILAGLDVLTTTKSRFRFTNHGLVLLEMAVVRLIRLADLLPIAQITQWLTHPGNRVPSIAAIPAKNQPGKAPATTTVAKKNGIPDAATVTSLQTNQKSSVQTSTQQALDTNNLELLWKQVRGKVGDVLATHLEKAGLPAISGPKGLVVRFPARYTDAEQYCRRPEVVVEIETALKHLTGSAWSIRVELAPPSPNEPSGTGETTAAAPTQRQRQEELLKSPLLQRAVEVLGARLLKMDKDFGSDRLTVETTDTPET